MRKQVRKDRMSRRDLLGGAAALATISIVPRRVLGGPGQTAPSDRLCLAGVGVGGVGFGQLQACEKTGFQIVALCDVDEVYAGKAFNRWRQARRHRDFREMLPAEGSKIDAVYCGTPDHSHAVITLAALRQKKHVCCVKPLTRTILECRTVVEAARQARVATQVTASPNTSEKACRAVCHDILHFSARVLANVVALPSATPDRGGFQRWLGRERFSSSHRFSVAPPARSARWLLPR